MARSFDASASERLLVETLELVAEGLAQDMGFGLVVISTLDDDEMLTRAAVAGVRAEPDLRGHRYPASELERELRRSDVWGRWRFVPHDRIPPDEMSEDYVPVMPVVDADDAWHPMDLLFAPLYDEEGVLRGTIGLDIPLSGKRPDATQRDRLDEYARRASRAVVDAVERERLHRQTRLSKRLRHAVREINDGQQLKTMLQQVQPLLTECFDAHGSWLHLNPTGGYPASDRVHNWCGEAVEIAAGTVVLAEPFSTLLWEAQETGVLGAGPDADAWLTTEQQQTVDELLGSLHLATALFVPLGSGRTPLGHLLITRSDADAVWTQEERSEALDFAHDLGAAIVRIRVAEREAQLLRELRDLHLAKDQLMDTVTHDLRNPLSALDNLLRMLRGMEEIPPEGETMLDSISQVSRRMRRLTDQLMALSRSNRDGGLDQVTDLGTVVGESVEVSRVLADAKGVTLQWTPPSTPVHVAGDSLDVGSIAANLIGNAVTYTPSGGEVRVVAELVDGLAVLEVTDTGIGIAEEDRERIFEEFDRSANPQALRESGSGLGLAIVRTLCQRLGATITVESEVDKGSTFRVVVPAASP